MEAANLARRERQRLHLVNGIWAEPAFAMALTTLKLMGSRFVIHSEGPDNSQRQPAAGRWLRAAFGQWIARSATGILAISHFAADFYRELGCPDQRLYPFGYFRALPDSTKVACETPKAAQTEIIFVGQLIHRKGVDVLLDAMRLLLAEYAGWRLTLIGDGDQRLALEAQTAAAGLRDRIAFTGAMAADQVQSQIAAADLLVLPSRWDGWGMVINEALAAGVPVIASDQCGASDLIRHGVNGYVFRNQEAQELRDCLRQFCNRSHEERRAMRVAARLTGDRLAADIAARYLIACLKHMTGLAPDKPVAPWLAPARIEALGR
jgi:glycosyltransferase involved in cell wall biosynthesis